MECSEEGIHCRQVHGLTASDLSHSCAVRYFNTE